MSRAKGATQPVLIVDEPRDKIRRLTLNRPDKRNALNDELRGALFEELRAGDRDRDVAVMIVRGGGSCFSAGYDLGSPNHDVERSIAKTDGWWPRHVVNNWFEMWDMATPIIGQVHGYCLAGGTELATACDLVYVAEDAAIGYPPVRLMSPTDMQWQTWMMGLRRGMEALLTGDSMSGSEAVAAGFANRAFPLAELDDAVLDVATRVAKIPGDLLALNK
ncbi:MAG: enoyl-CoA hydratase/isomerase family protein, partial [Ilumatobacteraceae bacterium]